MLKLGNRLDVYEPGQLKHKFGVLLIIVAVVLTILALRLWYLQVIKGDDFRQRSENNSLRLRKIKPLRGLIMDRNRKLLTENRPSFNILFIPDKARDINKSIDKIKWFYSLNSLELAGNVSIPDKLKPFVPVTLERNATMEKVAVVEIHSFELPGVVTEITPVRQYLYGEANAQIIGFTGEVSRREIEQDIAGHLSPGDNIGKFGIEKSLDAHLRGESGAEQVEINATGKIVRSLGRIPPKSGNNVVLNIDLELQKAAWEAVGNRRGAVVALNPKNGDVLTLISSPSFDPNIFTGELSADEWEKLSSDPQHPMENRAIAGQYPPGSTYKPIMAAAALETGTITSDKSIYCNGAFEFGDRIFHDWKKEGHGEISLHRAIVESCDVYFYNLGKMLNVDTIAEYARGFGLGAPTGIDLPREKSGLVPTRQWKKDRLNSPWHAGETISLAIGQGFNLVTPLQLVSAYAALANGGTLYRPRIVKQIESPDGRILQSFPPEIKGLLPVSTPNITTINKGLWGVVNERGGTGYLLKRAQQDVCGKTGTAQVIGLPQNAKEKKMTAETNDHALFVCFAPCENPEIVIAVILENAGHGGATAAPVAKKMLDVYFSQKNKLPERRPSQGAPASNKAQKQ
ncbi:MAG: penicillin-binding protein 2 [Syntrophales bacterium]|jgi:penicillin-binding protein 2|nr:penicillin-binding protein 2 [Syntrophales bacterium]